MAQRNATVVAALVLSASYGLAQLQFDELVKRHLPNHEDLTSAVALGDVDGDGDADLVCGNRPDSRLRGGRNRLYLNDGAGVFTDATASRLPADLDFTGALAFADVDGDGDPDLVLGNIGQNRLYLNDGRGAFTDSTAARMPSYSDHTVAVAVGDVDGDGDLDLVLANAAFPTQQNRLYLNDGTGTFADATSGRMPAYNDFTSDVAMADVDGDGDPDLVFGNQFSQNRLYLNDGTGRFTDRSAAGMPTDRDQTLSVALDDVDADGDQDLLVGNWMQQNRMYLNDGTGTFTDGTAMRMPSDNDRTLTMTMGDVDGDGDPDVVWANSGQQNRLYLNDGTGAFVDATAPRMPEDGDSTGALALGDVDGDRDPDLVLGNSDRNRLYLNDGSAAFTDATAERIPAYGDFTEALALGDVDGDADNDLVIGNAGSSGRRQNRLYLNDGRGRFDDVSAARMPAADDITRAVELADLDGDGDPDLVSANRGQNRLYSNDGSGTFTDVTLMHMPADNDDTFDVAIGDVDGDGDADMVLGNGGSCLQAQQTRLYMNDGAGRFTDVTAARLPSGRDGTASVALVDVDADGDLDLVLGNGPDVFSLSSGQNRLYTNDGTGTFTDATAQRLPADNDCTLAVALGDVDGDGDPDIVLGNAVEQNRLYLNDGAGRFTDVTSGRVPVGRDSTQALALGDVDGDGDTDVVFGNYEGQNRLYSNDGAGRFSDVTAARMPTDSDNTFAVALGDVDGDGDQDLVFGNWMQRNKPYLNLLRHLDTPLLVVLGREYRMAVYARYGRPRLVDVALPFVSGSAVRIPLPPLGTLGLNPAFLMALPPFVIPQRDGVETSSGTVPNDPSLAGVVIHAQALLLQWPAALWLTNSAADEIVR